MNDFASINALKLATITASFCERNNIPVSDQQTSDTIANGIYAHICDWYNERGRKLDPFKEIIEDDAIASVFSELEMFVHSLDSLALAVVDA